MTSPVYIAGKSGVWHVARHKPVGYGVASLCGKSWREGDFQKLRPNPRTDFQLCRTCERKATKP